jgi:diguanylate cyclase (GGDEF)-like protein
MDMAMLVVACRLILGAGQRPAAFYLLVANLLTIFTADTLYGLQQLRGTYQAGNFLDAIWLTGNLCLGAAALHPTMTRLTTPSPVPDQRLGLARLAALSAAALTAPGVLLIQNTWGTVRDASIIAVACAVLFLLVIARLAALVTDQRLLAITDSLTGLRTRRYIEAQLTTEISRADRAGGSLGVFIIDVDRFKAVNDRYGHPAGDRALIEIAARLRTAARAGDILARYGGEEFALLAPGMTTEAAHHLADRLHSVISATPVAVTPHTCLPITVSVGAATYPDHASDQTTLISTADRALYTAKTTGRDRVIMATAGPPNPAIPHPQPQPQNRPA